MSSATSHPTPPPRDACTGIAKELVWSPLHHRTSDWGPPADRGQCHCSRRPVQPASLGYCDLEGRRPWRILEGGWRAPPWRCAGQAAPTGRRFRTDRPALANAMPADTLLTPRRPAFCYGKSPRWPGQGRGRAVAVSRCRQGNGPLDPSGQLRGPLRWSSSASSPPLPSPTPLVAQPGAARRGPMASLAPESMRTGAAGWGCLCLCLSAFTLGAAGL